MCQAVSGVCGILRGAGHFFCSWKHGRPLTEINILTFLGKQKAILKELQQLVRHLNFVCKLWLLGLPFCRNSVIPCLVYISHTTGSISSVACLSTSWFGRSLWDNLLEFPSGGRTCRSKPSFRSPLMVWDPWGLGFSFVGTSVPRSGLRTGWQQVGSKILCFWSFLVIVWLWGKDLAGYTVHFWDNLAVVHIINSLIFKPPGWWSWSMLLCYPASG